jgi:hypothetical protein
MVPTRVWGLPKRTPVAQMQGSLKDQQRSLLAARELLMHCLPRRRPWCLIQRSQRPQRKSSQQQQLPPSHQVLQALTLSRSRSCLRLPLPSLQAVCPKLLRSRQQPSGRAGLGRKRLRQR